MNFNFDGFSDIKESTGGNHLRPWGIYNEVNFGGVSDKLEGTKKDGTPWKAWDFTFNAKEGVYNERIFEPQTTDDTEYNGKKIPSDFKRAQQFIVQVLSTYNPKGLEKLREITKSGKVKTFEQFIGLVKQLLEKPIVADAKNNIQIKLQGRKSTNEDGSISWYAKLPNCSYGNDGKPFMSQFLGKNLTFSSWEEQQKNIFAGAKPTNPETSDPVTDNIDNSSEDEISNFDKLLED